MDHQIEQDVDVERAADENAEALGFDVEDVREDRRDGDDGRVVALDVADLQDAIVRVRRCR